MEGLTGRKRPIEIGETRVYLIWFDSLGAKSSSILVETPDLKILVDPGVAAMQPSYPLPASEKEHLRQTALEAIKEASLVAEVVFISHYHYDHHTLPSQAEELYKGKKLWIKDPNLWINHSQWERARLFLGQLYQVLGGSDPKGIFHPPNQMEIQDPLKHLPLASAKDYGDYQKRKRQLLEKGRAWFQRMRNLWLGNPWVSEFMEVRVADGRSFKKDSTSVRFTDPLFHGIEYDRVGWVIGLVVEHKGTKVIYTSDLQGPSIEDYAQWIIDENPDILVLDGPATYLFGYMLNRINLQRAIDNVCSIIRNTDTKVIIYDHHLLRDTHFRERMAQVYTVAREERKTFLTAAEWLGQEPLVERLARK